MSEVLWGFPPQIYQPLQNLVLKNKQIKEASHLGQSARIHLFKIPDKENRIARGPVVLAGFFSFLFYLIIIFVFAGGRVVVDYMKQNYRNTKKCINLSLKK